MAQINAALVNIRDVLKKKHLNVLSSPNSWMVVYIISFQFLRFYTNWLLTALMKIILK